MSKYNFFYFAWQCVLVLICGVVGLIAVSIKPALSPDIAILFALAFIMCIITALFFLIWMGHERKREAEDRLIESIGEAE